MHISDDPAKSADADARVLEAAGAILFRRYGELVAGDLVRALSNRAHALKDEAARLRAEAGPQPEPEGWGVIRPGDRRAHYYVGSMSLCRRVGFYNGPLDPDAGPSPDDHKECRRLLTRHQAATAAEPGHGYHEAGDL